MAKKSPIYLDYQATTPLDKHIAESVFPFYFQSFGNPASSEHSYGWQASSAVENARQEVANLISADSDEIVFTSGATEANNLAILGIAKGNKTKRNKILISAIEHKSVLAPARQLSNDKFIVETIPVNSNGEVDTKWLEDNLDDKTLIVSIMAINNEIGTIQDLNTISKLCHSAGALFHVDASQAFPSISIDVFEQGIDLLSISGHKIYAPKGIGALYIKRDLQASLEPLQWGGEQENGLRPGTVPTPLCVGIGKAASLLSEQREQEQKHLIELRNSFYEKIRNNLNDIRLIGPELEKRHSGNLNIYFPNIDAQELISCLQPLVAISTGSACTSGITQASHVLSAIGLPEEISRSCIRISFGRMTTDKEITDAVNMVTSTYHTLTG